MIVLKLIMHVSLSQSITVCQAVKKRRVSSGPTAAEILLLFVQNISHQHPPEVPMYLKEPSADVNSNQLAWWKVNGATYLQLTLLALDHLGIPATLVPSETIFSKAGKAVSRHKASLKPCLHFFLRTNQCLIRTSA